MNQSRLNWIDPIYIIIYGFKMQKLIEYYPLTQDLLLCRTADEFITSIRGRRALVTIIGFQNIESIVPLLGSKEREKIYDFLLASDALPFISAFNVLEMQVYLPEVVGVGYKLLREIEVDEMNITRTLTMIESKMFPSLVTLKIHVKGDIILPLSELENSLVNLGLYNESNEIRSLPQLPGSIENLDLLGYMLEFRGRLPRKLRLEQCYVKKSGALNGCEEMDLINTRWDSISFPTKSLSLQDMIVKIPLASDTLVHLSLIETSIDSLDLELLPELRSLRILDRTINVQGIEQSNIRVLTLDEDSIPERLPESLRVLNMKRVDNSLRENDFENLVKLVIIDSTIDVRDIIEMLPDSLEELVFSGCTFTKDEYLKPNEFPSSLRTLEFIGCTNVTRVANSKENLVIDVPSSLSTLKIVGKTPILYGKDRIHMSMNTDGRGGSGSFRWIRTMTNSLLMTPFEFHVHCLEKSIQLGRKVFIEFEQYYRDIAGNPKWLAPNENAEYIKILIDFPFHIVQPSDPIITKTLVAGANEEMVIMIDKEELSMGSIRKDLADSTRREFRSERVLAFLDQLI